MSWSVSCNIPENATTDDLYRALLEMEPNGNEDCPEERKAAFEQARHVVKSTIEDGSLGTLGERGFHVSMTGHCNPDNKPREGMSNDFVSITITQT